MPSSTSNSELRIALRIWALAILVLSLALLAVQQLVQTIGAHERSRIFVHGPAYQATRQLDAVAHHLRGPPNVIIFGSSRTGRGFDRFAYEAELKRRCKVEVRAWRFGFGFIGVSPTTQRLMAREMADILTAWRVSWDLALVEFTPFQNTVAISENEYGAGQDHWMTYFSTPEDFAADLWRDTERTLRLMSYAFVYEGSNPHRLTRYFIERTFGPEPPKPANPRVKALWQRLQAQEPNWFPLRGWQVPARGAAWSMSAGQLSAPGMALLQQIKRELEPEREAFMARDRKWRIECCDAERLRLDPVQLTAFRGLLAQFARMAAKTAVYLPPENRDRLKVTPSGDRRVDAFVSGLDVPVLDLSDDPNFNDADFFDSTHLDELGAVKMSERLAAQTAAWLCGPKVPTVDEK